MERRDKISIAPGPRTAAPKSKIARLPYSIREQLNLRLRDGEPARAILPWINSLPETRAVIGDYRSFGGNAPSGVISEQQLSKYRHSPAYLGWLERQKGSMAEVMSVFRAILAALQGLGPAAATWSRSCAICGSKPSAKRRERASGNGGES